MSDRTREMATVRENSRILDGYYKMTLHAPVIAQRCRPGQFVFIQVGNGTAPLLRRPISICEADSIGGTLTLLEKYLHSHALKSPAEYGELHGIRSDVLDSASDFDSISDLALLTQAGYLTIKRSQGRTFFVGYPNFEVADSMASLYTNMLLRNETLETVGAGGLEVALKTAAFAALDYQQYPIINEKYCQAFLQVFIFGANYDVTAEKHTAFGRSDLEFDAGKYHWVIELKFQRKKDNAEALLSEAVDQIRDRNYGATSSKELVRAAAVFSEEKRAFVGWQEVPA